MEKSGRLGMSLPQIALIFIILSAVAGGASYLQPAKKSADDAIALNAQLDKIEEAIYSFFLDKGYLPCPASGTALDGTATFGMPTDCNAAAVSGVTDIQPGTVLTTIRNGVIPVRALNLPDSYMYDHWGNRINYSVIKKTAIDKTTFSDLQTAITEDIFKIREESNNQLNNLYSATNQVFITHVLYSNGKNRKGGTNSSGITSSCAAGTADYENCNGDNIFRYAQHVYANNSSYYDDFIRWYTNKQLYYCSGATNGCNTPPAGFTPASIYGLIIWLDANDYSTFTFSSGNNISTWKDKSTYAYIYTTDSGYQPVYSATGFNSKPTVTAVNSKGLYFLSSTSEIPFLEYKNFTFFFAGKQNAVSGANYIFTAKETNNRVFNLNANGYAYWYKYKTDAAPLSTSYSSNLYSAFVLNATAPNPRAKLYINGVLKETGPTYLGMWVNHCGHYLNIARNTEAPTTNDFNGNISEIIMYSRELSDSERQYVENYLKAKWGL